MADTIFNNLNLDKMAAEDPAMAEFLGDYISDADYSDLKLDGLAAEEMYQLGKDYRDAAHNRKTDPALAKKYFQVAADRNYTAAWSDLGKMYLDGLIPNYEKALRWLKKAAEAGRAEAMFSIGEMYASKIPVDMKEAARWVIKAAETGDPGAIYTYSLWLDPPDGMPCGGMPVNKAKSFELLKKAAGASCAEAMYQLGQDCSIGNDFITKDLTTARAWLVKALDAGMDIAEASINNIDEEINSFIYDDEGPLLDMEVENDSGQ